MRGQRQRERIECGTLLVEAQIAVQVGKTPANADRADGKRLIAQQSTTADFDNLYEIVAGPIVQLPTLDSGVHEGTDSDVRDEPGPTGADFRHELGDHACGKHVGLDLVHPRQLLHARRPNPMATDHTLHHALVGEAIDAATLPISQPQGVHERQVPGGAGC